MMDYHELISELTDEENPNVLDYIDDAVEMLEHLYSELKAANARCETLGKMVTQYQDELIPGYRERAEKAERERDELKARYERGEPCESCKYYYEHVDGCDKDCLACSRDCPCNTCREYGNWEYDE